VRVPQMRPRPSVDQTPALSRKCLIWLVFP
jgi:hypothetical protein